MLTERTPEQDRAEAARTSSDLRSSAAVHQQQVRQQTEQHIQQLRQDGAAQVEAIRTRLATGTAAIRTRAASARAGLHSAAGQQKAALQADLARDLAAIDTATQAVTSEATASFAEHRGDLLTFAASWRTDAADVAAAETARATAELETSAQECEQAGQQVAGRYSGSEDPKPTQRSAAHKVAADSARDIRDKKSPIAADLRSRAGEQGAKYDEYAGTVAGQITEASGALLPGLEAAAERARSAVRGSVVGALAGIDQRLAHELEAVTAAEEAAIGRLSDAARAAQAEVNSGTSQAAGELQTAGDAITEDIENNVVETTAVLDAEEHPFMPGVTDVAEAANSATERTATSGCEQLSASTAGFAGVLADVGDAFDATATNTETDMAEQAEQAAAGFASAAARVRAERTASAQVTITGMQTSQRGSVSDVMSEVARTVGDAEQEMRGMADQFRNDIREANTQTIIEATRPRTDDVTTRASEAAAQVDEGWLAGLGRALAQIAVGLVIMVVVALVVAAVAAAFGVILTAWTAVMIAGAILLAAGFVYALIQRSRQQELQGNPLGVVGMALLDTVGITGIIEGVRGKELLTDRPLSAAARTERGVLGAVTLVSLVLGVRSAIKGPPGGVYVRPTGAPRGWAGFRGLGTRMWGGARSVAVEMATAVRQGVRYAREWVRAKRGQPPSPELIAESGEPSGVHTNRASEQPYHHPPGRQVASRGNPLDLSKLDPSQRYLWLIDENGNFVIAPENSPGFGANSRLPQGRVVKHGDLHPGPQGQTRGVARSGGELSAEIGADGRPTGRWIMNNDSSYTFARTDNTVSGPMELEGAMEVLRNTGTDTHSIVPANSGNPGAGPANTRPSTGSPVVPPADVLNDDERTRP